MTNTTTPETNPTPTHGTCCVCERLFKRDRAGKVARHGYRRPGCGQELGRCFGSGFRSYEESADGCRAYQEYLAEALPRALAAFKRFDDGEVTELYLKTYTGAPGRMIGPTERQWDRLFSAAREQAARYVLDLERGVKRMAQLVEAAPGR